ncbi:MAG: repair protein RecN, partial [Gaiellales bacterium]|nr:repair protein RecN [Gaiellales bacterium]
EELVVENLVLVRSARLVLHPGLNVLTGETGAGKTILAEAVGLLLGGRADAALVGPAAAEAYVEATFSDVELPEELADLAPEGAEGVVVARRVGREGRSRALLYGRSCTRDDLERIGQSLIEMVSQHEARRLVRPAVQLDLIDASGGDKLAALRNDAGATWRALATARRALAEAEAGAAGEQARLAELRALAEAVAGVDPQPGEEDELVRERTRLRHLDVLLEAARAAAELLNPDEGAGAVAQAGEAAHALDRVRDHDPALARPADELARIAEELRETAIDLRSYLTGLDSDPATLDRIEERLEQLAELRRRFAGESAADLRPRAEAAALELAEGERADERIARAAAGVAEAEAAADRLATALHKARVRAGPPFARSVERHLADRGMDGARLEVAIGEAPLGGRGRDAVELRLAANPGLPAGPLGSVASGGELSRIALAVRLAARDGGATEMLVFDEVDAGIGGRTARVLTDKLRELAATAQVLCITHLPQIAAAADRHFLVEKTQGETSEAHVEQLDADAALEELVRMLGADAGDADARALAISLRGHAR